MSNNNSNDFKQITIDFINDKFYKNELNIEDFLQNDNCINDLLRNDKSRFKKLLTSENIKKLINYCLNPNFLTNQNSQKELRLAYYSSNILCSKRILLFEKSIQNIKESNNLENNINNNKNNNNDLVDINNKGTYSLEDEDEETLTKPNINNSPNKEESIDIIEMYDLNEYKGENENEYEKDLEEKYINLLKDDSIPTERQIEEDKKKIFSEYENCDLSIINGILNEIFKVLNIENYCENQTYIGYFQKIVNYLLFYESDVTINFLFNDSNIFRNLYHHLSSFSIQCILENILNILSDNEKYMNNFFKIINDLLEELNKDDKFEKAESICQIIIDTLINNTEKQLIILIFENDDMLKNIKNLINKIINIKNNDKILINLLEILCSLNEVIISSIDDWESYGFNNEDKDIFVNDYKKINAFECQYKCKKKISNKNILSKFIQNPELYISIINEIYNTIKNNIKQNNININNNKKFGLKHLNEWEFILSSLKIYIFSFYILGKDKIEYFKFKQYLSDKELFQVSIQFFFQFVQNNLYQNIFINIIKLISIEKCPDYLTVEMFQLNNNENLIDLIIENLKIGKNDKKKYLLIAPNVEILKIVFSSINPVILESFKKSKYYNIYKELYIDSLEPIIERTLNEDYSSSFSQIFSPNNNNNETYDGNDTERKLNIIKPIFINIQKFLDKCNKERSEFKKKVKSEIVIEKKNGKKIKKKLVKIITENKTEKNITIEYDNSNNISIGDELSTLEKRKKFYIE